MVVSVTKFMSTFRGVVVLSKPKLQSLGRQIYKTSIFSLFSTETRRKVDADVTPVENIRNFCIIAHVDHGKSTLADRLLEVTGTIDKCKENQQVLDRLPVEKQRGITVKAVTASLSYKYNDTDYLLNLIDTPGHVDFSNEVSRSLYACQGVILLIDANEGIQAQTVSNFYLAFTMELTIIPVLNKIDLPRAKPEVVEKELEALFGFEKSDILRISAKTGLGVEDLLKRVIEKVPPPNVSRNSPFKALLIDSWFDSYRGSILFIYIASGEVRKEDIISSQQLKKNYPVKYVAKLTPEEKAVEVLQAGQVGILACNIRSPKLTFIGDTLYAANSPVEPIKSFSSSKPMVFAGLFPTKQSEHEQLRKALEKLCLNDPAVTCDFESSPALGNGWRLGFLGLLHLDVFRQRLEQEFDAEAVLTSPSITYRVKVKGSANVKKFGKEILEITNPLQYPSDPSVIEETFEPVALATIIAPVEYYQQIIDECSLRRGLQESVTPLESERVMIKFVIPLGEILFDFHDKIKSLSSGFASFDYEDHGFASAPLCKMRFLLNGKEVEELTMIVHKDRVREMAQKMTTKLQASIPRQQVEIAIQAVVGSEILSRKNIKPYRKDVTAKLYGRDVTRRMKLLANQREGKKKMRSIANIQVDRDIFIDIMKND